MLNKKAFVFFAVLTVGAPVDAARFHVVPPRIIRPALTRAVGGDKVDVDRWSLRGLTPISIPLAPRTCLRSTAPNSSS